jgi:hypothetical protein
MKQTRRIASFMALSLLAVSTHASVLMQHSGATDPINEGWVGTSGAGPGSLPAGDVATGSIDDNGTAAWFVDDSSTRPYGMYLYYHEMDNSDVVDGLNRGWSMDVTLRVVDIPDTVDASVLSAVSYNNHIFSLSFGSQADGDPIVRLGRAGGPEYVLEGAGDGYHNYSLRYDPEHHNADLFVDGIEVLSDFEGTSYSLSVSRLMWGSLSSFDTGHGNFSDVTFAIGTHPPPSIDIITPLNAAGCVEATGPAGALVEASVGNFIDDPSIVYHWSTSTGAMTNGTNFVFELGINEAAIIFLTAEDTVSGETASSFKQVRVSDTTSPDITILSPDFGDAFAGNNLHLEVEIKDAADPDIKDYKVNIGSQASYPLNPETGNSRVKLSKPTPGAEPIATDITVTAEDASGNTSSATVQVMQQHDSRK